MSDQIEPFGTTPAGEAISRLTLSGDDLTVKLLTRGALLQDVRLAGVPYSLTLGCDDPAAYDEVFVNFGAIVGPVANRIANAKTVIDGVTYEFEANEGGVTTTHSGSKGTHRQVWDVVELAPNRAHLRLEQADGHAGFPGNRRLDAVFEITGPGQLTMTLTGETDQLSPINLANHSYWNLDGTAGTEGHILQISADRYLPIDDLKIPTGTAAPVEGTPFDFRQGRGIGTGQADAFDHNFCLSDDKVALRPVAKLTGASGVSVELETTEPGLQVYDAIAMDTAPFIGLQGFAYGKNGGIALEAQGWPDAPNQPGFPSVMVEPGATYQQITRWTFRP